MKFRGSLNTFKSFFHRRHDRSAGSGMISGTSKDNPRVPRWDSTARNAYFSPDDVGGGRAPGSAVSNFHKRTGVDHYFNVSTPRPASPDGGTDKIPYNSDGGTDKIPYHSDSGTDKFSVPLNPIRSGVPASPFGLDGISRGRLPGGGVSNFNLRMDVDNYFNVTTPRPASPDGGTDKIPYNSDGGTDKFSVPLSPPTAIRPVAPPFGPGDIGAGRLPGGGASNFNHRTEVDNYFNVTTPRPASPDGGTDKIVYNSDGGTDKFSVPLNPPMSIPPAAPATLFGPDGIGGGVIPGSSGASNFNTRMGVEDYFNLRLSTPVSPDGGTDKIPVES